MVTDQIARRDAGVLTLTSLPSLPDVVFASVGGVDEPAGAPEGLGGRPPPLPLRAAILSAMLEPPLLLEGPFAPRRHGYSASMGMD